MTPVRTALLRDGFLRSCDRFPDRIALSVQDVDLSYRDLLAVVGTYSATLESGASSPSRLTAVFGRRSIAAYAGVLAALHRGHGYLPLNPTFPVERTRMMIAAAGCRELVVDAEAAHQLDALLAGANESLTVLLPEETAAGDLRRRWPRHRILGRDDLVPFGGRAPGPATADDIAYVIFTSGSTGKPKGVMVTHRNVRHYVNYFAEALGISESDRFSQMSDLTFDQSVHDMFVAWERGAALIVPSAAQVKVPGSFIVRARLTHWFSVPTVVAVMDQLGLLRPDSYPGLRLSLFGGEALSDELARAWARAAPQSRIFNTYGPTETTITCVWHEWREAGADDPSLATVPIGEPLPGTGAVVMNEALVETADGEAGELLISGPLVTPGYLDEPARTAEAFVACPGRPGVHYRTGDRVRRIGPGGPLVYLGRPDSQLKIRGHRVELGEIEVVLRRVAGVSVAVVVPWPRTSRGADGVVAFLERREGDERAIRSALHDHLPRYMIPAQIRFLADLPRDGSGKLDRRRLSDLLDAEKARHEA